MLQQNDQVSLWKSVGSNQQQDFPNLLEQDVYQSTWKFTEGQDLSYLHHGEQPRVLDHG